MSPSRNTVSSEQNGLPVNKDYKTSIRRFMTIKRLYDVSTSYRRLAGI